MSFNDSINIPKMDLLFKLCNRGIIALINENDKKVYITATNSMLGLIERYTTDLKLGAFKCKEMNKDRDKLQFSILDMGLYNIKYYKYGIRKYYEMYKNLGYSIYNEDEISYISIYYKFHKRISSKGVELYLQGKSRSNNLLIGKFEKLVDCDEFCKVHSIEDCLKMIDGEI